MIDYLVKLDTQLFLWLNGMHSPFWDSIMLFASGKLTWLPLYLIIVYIMVRRYQWKAIWWLVAIAFVILLTDQFSVHLFKNVFQRLRPCHEPNLSGLIHLIGSCGKKYGFVSSHAANTFGVATLLSLLFRMKWVTIGLISWATFVSYSRIYLGVHYPADVIVGGILGASVGFLVWLVADAAINRNIFRRR